MTPEQSIPLVSAMLLHGSSAWHPDYERVVQYAELCRKFATGDVASLLAPYWGDEAPEDLAKLISLYVATCESTWMEIRTPFYQVGRLRDGQVERKVTYADTLGKAERDRFLESVNAALDTFYNGKPLQDYLAEHIVQTVAMTDPNAWMLTAYDAFDFRTERAKPYPVLLPCTAVVDFTRAAGTITSMTARYVVTGYEESLYRYITYLADYAVDYWPVDSKGKPTIPDGVKAGDGEVRDPGGAVLYHYRLLAHNIGKVPACPVGYVPDQGAVGLVFLSPLHAAISWLKLELKTGHELQIVMRNMASPRQLQYVQPCTGYPEDGGCTYGNCTTPRTGNPQDLRCRKCGGTGQTIISKSSRDILTVPLSPDPTENKLKLTDYLAFVGPEPAIPDFQLKFQDWIAEKLMRQLFNTNTLIKDTTVNTATQKRQEQNQKAIALTPFADQFAYLYTYHGEVAAAVVDAGKPAIIYDFPPDLELTSIEDLYGQLDAANKAMVRPDEIARIQLSIMRKSLSSDPQGLRKYQVRSRFIPLLGLSPTAITAWSALGKIPEDDVLVYVNQDRIFADAEQANPRFYDLSYQQQADLVQQQVDLIKSKLPAVTAGAGSFGRLNLTTPAPAAPVDV